MTEKKPEEETGQRCKAPRYLVTRYMSHELLSLVALLGLLRSDWVWRSVSHIKG